MAKWRMDFKTIDGNTDKLQDLIDDLKATKTKFEENIKTDYKIKDDTIERLDSIISKLSTFRSDLKDLGKKMHDDAKWVNRY